MKYLTFLITFTFILLCNSNAQTIDFEYDAAGNCVIKYKTITMPAPKMQSVEKQQNDSTEEEITDNMNVPAPVEDIIGDTKIVIYPNPTDGILVVEIQSTDAQTSVNYTLMQANGKHITSGTSADNPLLLNLSGFSSGVYLLRLTIDAKSQTYKILKQ